MPASSEIGWSMNHYKAPVFQVYGTKRKADDSFEMGEESMCDNKIKKPCLVEQDAVRMSFLSKGHPQLQQVQEIHAERTPSPVPTSWRSTGGTCDIEGAIEYHHNSYQNQGNNSFAHNNNDHHDNNSTYHQGNGHMQHTPNSTRLDFMQNSESQSMDIKEEEESSALMAMDSDCVPDSSQYESQVTFSSSHEPSTPSMVKCYCRPSWDVSPKPYVSDYY